MKHSINEEEFGASGKSMAKAVETCVHCGFCLPDCPTYREFGQEMDSPRGRIILMKEVLEGGIPLDQALPHVDRCLGCLACETTCPSGVKYGNLISPFRDFAESHRKRNIISRMRRKLLGSVITSVQGFRKITRLAKAAAPLRKCLPKALSTPLDFIPQKLKPANNLKPCYSAKGKTKGRVALLTGCAQQVLSPEINVATIELLTGQGIEVIIPTEQVCCGALAWHMGDGSSARKNARHNLKAFPDNIDVIITNAAGCGSGLHEYPLMLAGGEEENAAKEFASKVQDITVFLSSLNLTAPTDTGRSINIAYHDACHLAHAQGVRESPRALLKSIPGAKLIELPDPNICCGSAGTYNLEHPESATNLGRTKARAIIDSGADIVASGNIGCLTQLETHLRKLGKEIPIHHTVEILATAYRGDPL